MLTEKVKYRILEIIPGFLVWLTFIGILALSVLKPLWAIYFILIFVIYWIVRLFYMMVWLIISWIKYLQDTKTDWLEKIKILPKDYREYYHLIFLPTYQEAYKVVAKPFLALSQCQYDLKKFIVVLAGEERDQENFLKIAEQIRQEFADKFFP